LKLQKIIPNVVQYYFSLFGKYLMKIFRIAFASFLAAAALNAVAHPSMAKHKPSTVRPATTEHPAEKSYDEHSYEEDDSNEHDVPDVKDDNSPDEYEMTKKGRKYKTDKNDHPDHYNKSMCVETELDHNGGKTGWHSDKYDPTHYDDQDDVEHCGYHFPHETDKPADYDDHDHDGDGYDDYTGKKCPKKKYH
jgi:hypothetical protein